MTDKDARALWDRLITEHAGMAVHATVALSIAKWAEQLAREAMEEPGFRRAWREQVREATAAILAPLQGKSDPKVIQTTKTSDQATNGRRRKPKGRT